MPAIRAKFIAAWLLVLAMAAGYFVWSNEHDSRRMRMPEKAIQSRVVAPDMPVLVGASPAVVRAPTHQPVQVHGLVAAPNRSGMALLSINGAPASMFRIGDSIGRNYVLTAITSQGVTIRSTDGAHQQDLQLRASREPNAEHEFTPRSTAAQLATPAFGLGGSASGKLLSNSIIPTQRADTTTVDQGQVGGQVETSPSGSQETSDDLRGAGRPGVPSVPQ